MTDENRETEPTEGGTEPTEGGLGRRTMLKGAAVAGLAGSALSGTASAMSNTITFVSASTETFYYRFSVTGDIEPMRSDSGDKFVDGKTIEGACSKQRADKFAFSGEVTALEVSGPGKVFVNDRVVRDTTDPLPNRVVIEAEGPNASYRFRVTGRVEKGQYAGPDDTLLDARTVEGGVGGEGVDDYRYSGSLVFESPTEPLTVTLELNQYE